MVSSKDKGARGETVVRDALRTLTGLAWERTPMSGALDAKHGLKADLYVPNENNRYAVEVKSYEDDHLTSTILTGKNPQFFIFWEQAVRQGLQTSKKPLLIFKFNRSKIFVAFDEVPSANYRHFFINACGYEVFVALLDDWITNENPKFI